MQFTNAIALAVITFSSALAAPAPQVDYTKITYPAGTGANLPYYPPPPGGWESVAYPAGTGSGQNTCPGSPFQFTSTYHVIARGDQVVNNSNILVPGSPIAIGIYEFGINGPMDTICYVSSPCLNFISVWDFGLDVY